MDRGAHFYRCDFQVHTPRDINWTGARPTADADRQAYADRFIRACRQKGLRAVAITDHHDTAFFNFIRKAAQDEVDDHGDPIPLQQRIVIYPGMELTLGVPCQALLLLDADFPAHVYASLPMIFAVTQADASQGIHAQTVRLENFTTFGQLHELLDQHEVFRGHYIIFPNVSESGGSTMLRTGFANRYKEMPCVGGYPRLALLRQFLKEDGAIFVSIDDHELESLKALMGEIFGVSNHVATFIWKRRTTPDSRNLNGVSGDHEYVLCYQRTDGFRVLGRAKDLGKYTNPDDDPLGPWMSDNLTGLANATERPNLHYDIVHPRTGEHFKPHSSRGWIYGRDRMAELIKADRILWPRKPGGRPRLKRYLSDMQSATTGFSTVLDAPGNVEATKELGEIMGPKTFAFPKPFRLVALLIEQATQPGDLILDSFAGSGTTGHAVLSLNKPNEDARRFILVEMESNIAKTLTAERVRRVAEGYNLQNGEKVEGLGGGFRFCELSETLFDAAGKIRESVRFADLARHVYFTETGEPIPRERISPKSPLIGACRGVAIYLLYNGILGDKSTSGGNVLTRSVLADLPPFDGQKVIYCAGCLLGRERLQAERIIVRQTPYEITVS